MLKVKRKEKTQVSRKHFWKSFTFIFAAFSVLSYVGFKFFLYLRKTQKWLEITEKDYVETANEWYDTEFKTEQFYDDQSVSWLINESLPRVNSDEKRMKTITRFFMNTYNYYKDLCWGFDFYHPLARRCSDAGQTGKTAIEAATTLYMMHEKRHFDITKSLISGPQPLDGKMTTYEFITDVIGSLISAFELSRERKFLERAINYTNDYVYPLLNESKDGLVPADFEFIDNSNFSEFDVNGEFVDGSTFAYTSDSYRRRHWLNHRYDEAGFDRASADSFERRILSVINTSDIKKGTAKDVPCFAMEFLKLAELTGNMSYVKLAMLGYKEEKKKLFNGGKDDDFYMPVAERNKDTDFYFDVEEGNYYEGSNRNKYERLRRKKIVEQRKRGEKKANPIYPSEESFMEMIPKLYTLTRGRIESILGDHYDAVKFMNYSQTKDFTNSIATSLIYGAVKNNAHMKDDINEAANIIKGQCRAITFNFTKFFSENMRGRMYTDDMDYYINSDVYMYETMHTWDDDEKKKKNRIELVNLPIDIMEPLLLLWKRTGDDELRACAWKIFLNIRFHFMTRNGILSVSADKNDNEFMYDVSEPFFFGEVMKYMYMIFSDSNYFSPLEWVFSSSGQPFRIISSKMMDVIEDEIRKNL